MLGKIILILFIINTINSVTEAMRLVELNETNLLHSLDVRVTKLELKSAELEQIRAELELQKKETTLDFKILKAELESQKQKLEQYSKVMNDKEAQIQKLKTELKRQKINELNEKTKFLRLDLDRQENSRNEHDTKCQSQNCFETESINKPKTGCGSATEGNEWIAILRRFNGSVDFFRNWTEYQNGFGNPKSEFFLGLDKIHALTTNQSHELCVVLTDAQGVEKFEAYDEFAIGNADQEYVLHTLGEAYGTAGDSLFWHSGMKFSTFDRDNDQAWSNCALELKGAWWFNACHYSNLAGAYDDKGNAGVTWYSFGESYVSLKKATMLIRAKK